MGGKNRQNGKKWTKLENGQNQRIEEMDKMKKWTKLKKWTKIEKWTKLTNLTNDK